VDTPLAQALEHEVHDKLGHGSFVTERRDDKLRI
jgi:hypothetical protein